MEEFWIIHRKRKRRKRGSNINGRSEKAFCPRREEAMEQKKEREWKLISCPGERDKTSVMVEWNIVSEKGRILKRSLQQIDCHHPQLAEFGGEDCEWGCEGVIGKREK
jgi:hypothetical protein